MKRRRREFSRAMILLSELFDRKISRSAIELYYRLLSDYPWERVKAALATAARTLKFFPKPAELIELIEGRTDDGTEQEAFRAWQALLRAVRQQGSWGKNPFEGEGSPLPPDQSRRLCDVLEMLGGWEAACQWDVRDYHRILPQFVRVYTALARERLPQAKEGTEVIVCEDQQ